MNNDGTKNLCFSLMKADTEDEVFRLLQEAGYWDNPAAWRYYGDDESNASMIGAQMSKPEPAIVEKLINSVDASLVNECLRRGINPEADAAPKSIHDAVARFFDEGVTSSLAGEIKEWSKQKRTEIAKNITIAATGNKKNPCFTISDQGEGQTPNDMPDTFLSLHRRNKVKIQFVQGKFNMGGTGVLEFCGKHRMQLILTRRNPSLLKIKTANGSDTFWGFTIVRRENPTGGLRMPVYKYLAPVNSENVPEKAGVLRFSSDTMPIFPIRNEPYSREAEWGSLIKLYEYRYKNQSHILMRDGLLYKIDLLLPEIALPIRLHECRDYKGGPASYDTTLTGVGVRLADGAENLEPGFPTSSPMKVMGHDMRLTIYALKKGTEKTYKRNEGIIFTVNGQTHGNIPADFFRRKTVGHSFLQDSILVMIDCSALNEIDRYDLFMNSRDRLRSAELLSAIEVDLEDLLKHHQLLKDLKERRKREEIEGKLSDNKPLEDMLEEILKKSPTLSSLFLFGKKLSTPFKTKDVAGGETEYEGKKFPTYFKFRNKKYRERLQKQCHSNMRCRVQFETDAENEYFSRNVDRGEFTLLLIEGDTRIPAENYVGPNLENGIANLSITLPSSCAVGDDLHLIASVNDSTQLEPFINELEIKVIKEATVKPGKKTKTKPPTDVSGTDRELPMGITIPQIIPVYEEDWEQHGFDKFSAIKLRTDSPSGDDNEDVQEYSFFINMDNIYLKSEMKTSSSASEFISARFKYGMVLLGLAVIYDDKKKRKPENGEELGDEAENIEDRVKLFCNAIAPVLVPMIEYLGGELNLEELSSAHAGETE